MGLIVVLGIIYIGGPLGILFLLIGVIGVRRRNTPGEYGWPGLLVILGVILLIIAGLSIVEIGRINFGL